MTDEKFARGGVIEGHGGTSDGIPFPRSDCGVIITAEQVRRLGLSRLQALNLADSWFPVKEDGDDG